MTDTNDSAANAAGKVGHTPGLWTVESGTGDAKYQTEAKVMVYALDDCDNHPIADCSANHTCRMDRECEANAHLIAAAPDLLEALKDARFALYGNGPGNPKIDAAIAKATGQ